MRLANALVLVVFVVQLAACRNTANGVKADTKRALEKTGQGIEKAGKKIEGAGK